MPCLNEAETLETCISDAYAALGELEICGEVLIADNGSTDGSQEIARRSGARVVDVNEKGYGAAILGGIAAARGEFVVMGDADGSYNFEHAPLIVEKLREGYDLVMGNRFLGGIEPGAMPWHHRYIGNPVLSGIGRLFFGCPVKDFHCGLRGFRKDAIERLKLSTTGMEFASEMIIKATLEGLRIAEIPTTLRPDGRSRPPHLRSFRDGWRHLRFMLLYCPRWLFVVTGMSLFLPGLLIMAAIGFSGGLDVAGAELSVNSSLAAAMIALVGFQLLITGTFARQFASAIGIHPQQRLLYRMERHASLEGGIVLGLIAVVVGAVWFASAFLIWRAAGYGTMTAKLTVSRVIPSLFLCMVGIQAVFGSFLVSIIQLIPKRR
ncbi:MAG: glycosyltransferase family 2 protein [Planctomycetaceae bacterium]